MIYKFGSYVSYIIATFFEDFFDRAYLYFQKKYICQACTTSHMIPQEHSKCSVF